MYSINICGKNVYNHGSVFCQLCNPRQDNELQFFLNPVVSDNICCHRQNFGPSWPSLSDVTPMNMLHDMAKRDTADVVKISNQLNLKKIILAYLRVPNIVKQMLKIEIFLQLAEERESEVQGTRRI